MGRGAVAQWEAARRTASMLRAWWRRWASKDARAATSASSAERRRRAPARHFGAEDADAEDLDAGAEDDAEVAMAATALVATLVLDAACDTADLVEAAAEVCEKTDDDSLLDFPESENAVDWVASPQNVMRRST